MISLDYFRKEFSDMDICYLGDTLYVPYGEKELEWIHDRTFACLEWMFSAGCILIILACNTASAASIRERQQKFPEKKVLSVTRPWIEQIIRGQYHTIGLLATQTTVQTKIYDSVLHRFNPDYALSIEAIAANGIVDLLESDGNTEQLKNLVFHYCDQFSSSIQCMVLGCTHFPLIVPYIQQWMHEKNINLPLINPSLDAALSLEHYLQNHHEIKAKILTSKFSDFESKSKISQSSKTEYYVTGSPFFFQKQVKRLLGKEVEAKQVMI
jgi:glutamate racemase